MTLISQEGRRTAFRAAYLMGERGRELFMWLSGEDRPAARRDALQSLYLHWLRDRQFVFGLLDTLADDAMPLPPRWRRGRVLRFLAYLSITIYVNHPEDAEVVKRTTALWNHVLRERWRLHQLLSVFRASVFDHLKAIVALRTLQTLNIEELADPELIFRQQPKERARFLRMVPLVDPATRIDSQREREDLRALLESAILPHRILGALIIAIHAVDDPTKTAKMLGELRPVLTSQGLLWATIAYAVPLPDTPEAWVAQLESMTNELVDRHRATFMAEEGGILERFDIALLPLGLAYGKRGNGMPLFETLLERGRRDDPALAARIVRGLAPVGVYFPYAVFETLRVCADAFRDNGSGKAESGKAESGKARIADALVDTLSAMRALHFDAVDLFLQEIRAPDAIRTKISRQESSQVVSRCALWLGYYNNAVHESVNYPIMRDGLVIAAFEALGNAHSPTDFTHAYTASVLKLLKDTDFELTRWMERPAHR